MAWIILTAETVRAEMRLSPAETEAIQNIILGGQPDNLDSILADVIEEVRGYVAGFPSNTVGPDGTIPARLKASAVAVIRQRWLTGLDAASLINDARTQEYKDAWSTISIKVPAGSFRIDTPATPSSDENPQGPAPVIGANRLHFNRSSQDGIL